MRKVKFAYNEYYHLCGRGVGGKNIFIDEADRTRFIFLIMYFQSPTPFSNISFYIRRFLQKGHFGIKEELINKIIKDRQLELISFCLMDNHYHLIVRNIEDSAVSAYMQRVLMAYSKYFNAKYSKKGHLFQGPFIAVHIKNNTQLLHASAYVHKNPKELPNYTDSYFNYPYSSLKDYIESSRWGELLKTSIVLSQFKNSSTYKNFIETSTAKEYLENASLL
jgi:REP element-mobilizing transposase RayT